LAQLANLAVNRGQGRAVGLGLRPQAAPLCLGQPLGRRQPPTDVSPARQVEQRRPHWGILTEPLAPKALRVGAPAPGRGVRPGLPLAGAGTEPFPIGRIATLLALHQAWQEREGPAARLPGLAWMLPYWLLAPREPLGLHERGDRAGAPLLLGPRDGGDRPAGLQRPPPLGPQPGAERLPAGLANGRGP
jgi:hypothetical protein